MESELVVFALEEEEGVEGEHLFAEDLFDCVVAFGFVIGEVECRALNQLHVNRVLIRFKLIILSIEFPLINSFNLIQNILDPQKVHEN